MRIATWNLNNRVGKVRFRPEAADAAVALNVDVLVFTEFFPQQHEDRFRAILADAGWCEQFMSAQPNEIANRVLVASRLPIAPLPIDLPTFDQQFPANLAAVSLPSLGIAIVGVRVPAYSTQGAPLLLQAWEWLEMASAALKGSPAVLLGDLNVSTNSTASRGGDHLRRILASGWRRATPSGGATFFGHSGQTSEIDHILATDHCVLTDAKSIQSAGGFTLCGSSSAISDHAALVAQVELRQEP